MIRPATIEDYRFLVDLGNHPEVMKSQFAMTEARKKNLYDQLKRGDDGDDRYFLIEEHNQPVGYICSSLCQGTVKDSEGRVRKTYHLGFDLLPEFWGKGMMAQAISELFDILFSDLDLFFVLAECDGGNTRCKRMLQKAGFFSISVPLVNRIQWWRAYKRYTWFSRYVYYSENWTKRNVGEDNRNEYS